MIGEKPMKQRKVIKKYKLKKKESFGYKKCRKMSHMFNGG